jgi:phosphatidylserine/phosphatidylglycerophosphate/cardiolipin synthase-like enzyme
MQLSSTGAAIGAIAGGTTIEAEAYTLSRPIVEALEAAARRGARVDVTLAAAPYGRTKDRLARENARIVSALRAGGVAARLADAVHAKELRVDGTCYLDEKNWRAGDIVLRAGAAEAASIPTSKHGALALEARLLAGARAADGVVVETESFGSGNRVYSALKALAFAGASPRLLVNDRVLSGNARERHILEHLLSDGVRVRVTKDSSKLAAAGDRAWLGSANASVTFCDGDMSDWGVCTGNRRIVGAVRTRLEAQWRSAKEFRVAREPVAHRASDRARGNLGGNATAAAGREPVGSAG